MLIYKRFLLGLSGIFFLVTSSIAQNVTVHSIEILGLKRTRIAVVQRELTFVEGDTIIQAELAEILERNRNNLLNIGLFNEVGVNVAEWNTDSNQIDIVIELRESWYLYAVPILDLADRNFNVWWTTYNHSLDRLNLGARLDYLNFTGRNDKLKAQWQIGYTPKQEIEYRFPYLNKKQSFGFTTGILHSINKEVNFRSRNNKEDNLKLDERKLQERWRGQFTIQFRYTSYLRQELGWSYESLTVDTALLIQNPSFFRKGGTKHNIHTLKYSYEYDDRDLRIYPSKGIKAIFEVEKKGWGIQDDENLLTSTISMEWNHTSGKRWLHRLSGIGHYSLSRSQPSYIHYKAFGYAQKFVRGYELYVVDGLDYLIGKYQLSYKLLEKQINWRKLIPVEQFRKMPLDVYLSLHLESGRVNDPFTGDVNPLANSWLLGEGLGLNVLLYHNFLFQLNVNRNHLGEVGFFIHNHTSF